MQAKKIMGRHGFTLIEVMIVVAIVAILASVAVPSYLESVRRGNRAEAAATMLKNANWMEQQFTVNNTYVLPSGVTLPNLQSPESGTAKYDIKLAAGTTATTYALEASPKDTTDKCGKFTLDQSGKRTVGGTAKAEDCWGGR